MSDEKKHTSNRTWAGMIALEMRLTVYCSRCERSVEIDMSRLPPDENAIGRTFRCSNCGEKGHCTVSPKSNAEKIARGIPNNFIGPFPEPKIHPRRRRRR